ncbi:MAG TPA: TlyA family RNA methyltransferase [Actinomycetota bacterium]|nr:TlyA family RNA methyltransferase [Actinomycetota bacterium]
MTKPLRLDAELVKRGLVSSRAEAQRAIEAGEVLVDGLPATKPAALVRSEQNLSLARSEPSFVSRGGDKLDGALARFDVEVGGRVWLDAGASTGGFTDRLLRGGAARVIAVDVGYGQLDWRLRNDTRVTVLERINARHLRASDLPLPPDGVVADLSFISLTLVLPALAAVADPGADYVLLVKPQFEVGRKEVPRGGVVRDPDLWRAALDKVAASARGLGLGAVEAAAATPPGPAGNREFFVHLRRGITCDEGILERAVGEAAP